MNNFLHRWFAISFFNLLLVSILGVTLRFKIAFYLPFIEQKHVLHSHSHFAFVGWITQSIMILLVHHVSLFNGEQVLKKYRWLLCTNLVAAYGMLVSFLIQGYGLFSIIFSTLSIFVSYCFAWYYWKDLDNANEAGLSRLWFKAALIFSVISSFGAWTLAYMMASKTTSPNWLLAASFFFLHFQYNGWFMFACIGLLVSQLERINANIGGLKISFFLFFSSCIPAYFLSVLWLPLPPVIYWLTVSAVVAQLAGWCILLKILINNRLFISTNLSKYGKVLLFLAAIAFSIKLLLQSVSVHPALSRLSFSFRPIIIGYLHLNLLAVTSVFIIGYAVALKLLPVTRKMLQGVFIFTAGVFINEILLMIQGIAVLSYVSIHNINILLLTAAIILFTGICILFISQAKAVYGSSPK